MQNKKDFHASIIVKYPPNDIHPYSYKYSYHLLYLIILHHSITNITSLDPLGPGKPDNHTPLLRTLHITLVITSNPIPHGHEIETAFVKYIIVFGGKFQQTFGEAVVKVFLFGGVVEGGVVEVFGAVGY